MSGMKKPRRAKIESSDAKEQEVKNNRCFLCVRDKKSEE